MSLQKAKAQRTTHNNIGRGRHPFCEGVFVVGNELMADNRIRALPKRGSATFAATKCASRAKKQQANHIHRLLRLGLSHYTYFGGLYKDL